MLAALLGSLQRRTTTLGFIHGGGNRTSQGIRRGNGDIKEDKVYGPAGRDCIAASRGIPMLAKTTPRQSQNVPVKNIYSEKGPCGQLKLAHKDITL